MRNIRVPMLAALALAGGLALPVTRSVVTAQTDAFGRFFAASTPAETAAAIDALVSSGVTFDAAFARLREGRTYARDVPRGVVQSSYRSDDGEYFYTLDVPETYDPARKYQVRFQLHGGVGRIDTNVPPRPNANARLQGGEQIYVMPYAWRDAPWWTARQVKNLDAILDQVKRVYNVDENRVVLSGVSDGGTGAYYVAMRHTTPFASIVPLNGFFMVLKNETTDSDGDLFPHNLVNKPIFAVNGGRDPLYPAATVSPYVEQLTNSGGDVTYRPQPNAGHDTSWWPEMREPIERFVSDHPRQPLPDKITWETGAPNLPSRAHWLVVQRLATASAEPPLQPDANRMTTAVAPDFGIRASGSRINRVVQGSNAFAIGLRSGDVVTAINNQPIGPGSEVAELLRGFPAGRPLIVTVSRRGEPVRMTGRYAPTVLPGEAEWMFPPQSPSGRVDLMRSGNRVEVKARGVAAFTLLISPDQFDLTQPVTVTVNGRTLFEGRVEKSVRTLLEQAARDNDRTMLYAVALTIEPR